MNYKTPLELECARLSMQIYGDPKELLESKTFDHIIVNDNAQCGLKLDGDNLIIAHAGTNDLKDAKDDAMTGSRFTPSGVKVRKGFYLHSRSSWRAVRRLIREIDPTHLVFCGHSLGGSVALIQAQLAYEIFDKHQNTLRCITFGAPRTLSHGGAGRVEDNLSGRITRFVRKSDLVPSVPTAVLWHHTEGLVYLSGGQAFREGLKPVQTYFRNWGNLFRGVLTLAKNHGSERYYHDIKELHTYNAPVEESPTEGYEVLTA